MERRLSNVTMPPPSTSGPLSLLIDCNQAKKECPCPMRKPVRIVFAIASLSYGCCLLLVACGVPVPNIDAIDPDKLMGFTFVIAGLFYLPFVISYTRLQLNSPEGEDASPETKARQKQLSQACPLWRFSWHGSIGFLVLVFVGGPLLNLRIQPFLVFSGTIAVMTGIWFLFVYPIAVELFSEQSDLTQSSHDVRQQSQ